MIFNIADTDLDEYIERLKKINSCGRKVFVVTFGCQQNEADSEKIVGISKSLGYTLAENADEADLVIFNTCAIRRHAEEKALSMLGRLKALKKKNPELIIGVCGCMAAEGGIKEMLKNDFHYVSFTLEPNMLHKLPEVIYRAMADNKRSFIFGEDKGDIAEGMPMVRKHLHKAWVSIMYGCNNFCTYCIVPYVRGRERSRSSDDIIAECRELVESGCKEITLLGQNVNSYKGECDFPLLLDRIASIEGDFVIRFMTSHPKDVSDSLISVMREHTPKIAPYFHLPLQSGNDRILRRMNRTYGRARFLEIVEKLRMQIPDICLSTDIIVGFPGETDEDFEDTMSMVKRVCFDMIYAFKFSKRDGTPAARMDEEVEASVVEERMSRLLKLQDEISLAKNEKYVGRVERVLVDSVSKKKNFNTLNARTSGNKLVHFEGEEGAVGEYRYVKIVKADAYDLIAKEI